MEHRNLSARYASRRITKMFSHWELYVMALPAILYLAIFMYKPMYGVLIAFKDYKFKLGIMGSEWVGLDNFNRLFSSYWFPVLMRNTFTVSLLSLLLSFPFPIMLALMVNEIRTEKIKRTFQTVSYAPHFISTVVICGMVVMFLSPSTGIINKAINALGFESVPFMQQPTAFKWIYVISGIWQDSGWNAIIYFAALSGVDKSLLEAADIDGATRIQKIHYINFPVLVPTILVLLILQCGSLLNVGFEKAFLFQNATNLPGSEVLSTYVYRVGLEQYDFSFATAAGVFNSLVNCILLVVVNTLAKIFTKSSLW